MRAPTRSTRSAGRRRDRAPLTGPAGAIVLAATAAFGLIGSGTAGATGYEVVQDGAFRGPLADSWTCDGQVAGLAGGGVEGRPGSHDFAGCTQLVSVRPYGTYELTATVSGSFAFVGVSGGEDTEAVYRWADGPDRTRLHATVKIGAKTQILTVYFHGWYGQGPYQVQQISLFGSTTGVPACPDMTGAPPSPPRSSPPVPTRSTDGPAPASTPAAPASPAPAALVPSPSATWTGQNCLPPPTAVP
ncbi:hypothetical protein ACIQF6_23985 [Kitasatospora sp. NPDC092948]|uniref:hypothetical protein n=1 Tax=Kitasatospora sp. NPDC092948 TaxID=3364088 RepID=UPI0038275704